MNVFGAWRRWLVSALSLFLVVQAEFSMRHLSTVYLNPARGVEQMAMDTKDKIIYTGARETINIINATNPRSLTLIRTQTVTGADITDVELCGDSLYVTVDSLLDKAQGSLRVYRKYNGGDLQLLHEILVGVIPDNVQVRPGCQTAVVAVEAEAYDVGGRLQNPVGAVVIIKFPDGVENTRTEYVTTNRLLFEKFNSQLTQLQTSGFRVSYMPAGATVDMDIEPEYITIDEDSNKAYVSLQENNAVAVVDLDSEEITAVHGLGFKQFGELDASDTNGIQISYWPILGMYQPDAIKVYKWNGRTLLFTANEGDNKDYESINYDDAVRGKDISQSQRGSNIPEFVRTALDDDNKLGRLSFSNVDGRYPNGTYHTLYIFGARSFSIFDVDKNFDLVYDSGSHIEKSLALHCPHLFNGEFKEPDSRSDNKGPEPESITVGEIAGRLYIFVGNERPGTVSVYSLGKNDLNPRFETIFCDGAPDSSKTYAQMLADREVYGFDPEDIRFYPASESPSGTPILLVCGTVTGTVSLLELTATPDSPQQGDKASEICANVLLVVMSAFITSLSRS